MMESQPEKPLHRPTGFRKSSASLPFLLLIFLLVLSISGVLIWFYSFVPVKPGATGEKVLVFIKPGTSFKAIGSILQERRLIRSRAAFVAIGRITRAYRDVKAGYYELSAAMTPFQIMDKLRKGEVYRIKVTIPEGYTMRQIARLLVTKGVIDREASFVEAAKDRRLLDSFGISANSAEGFLFPDTYFFEKRENSYTVMKKMIRTFFKVFNKEMRKRAEELGMSIEEVVTLASLIEKETAVQQERRLISAVFHNRLKNGMRLQCDPSVIYGLSNSFDGNLKKEHLKDARNLYNTYVYKGLPPGPIANPGRDSLLAALYPADVSYKYFVSRNDGTHYFSTSLREHNAAVRRFQKTAGQR